MAKKQQLLLILISNSETYCSSLAPPPHQILSVTYKSNPRSYILFNLTSLDVILSDVPLLLEDVLVVFGGYLEAGLVIYNNKTNLRLV